MAPIPGLDEALRVFEDFLRRRGLKMTEQRRSMVRAALVHEGHFTAVDVYERLRGDGVAVSLATIYRSLILLEQAGVLAGRDFDDGQRRYERALTREHHDHVICTDCRAVVEFSDPRIEDLQERILADRGFQMVEHALTIFARCRVFRETGSCPRRAAAPRGRPAARSRGAAP